MKNVLIKFTKNIIPMTFLFLSFALMTSCGEDEEPPTDPDPDPSTVVASFTGQVDAENSLTYSFTNSSVVNGIDDKSFTSAWDFGGDGTSSDESPTHIFSTEGTYEVTLTVTASDGVIGTTSEMIVVTAPKNRYAVITDTADDDTGELRLNLDSIRVGRITYNYRVAAGPVDMDIADAFINVTGTSTSGRNSIVEVRLKDNTTHEFREGASDATIAAANFPEGVANEWVSVEVSWAADGTNIPTYSVVIGGQTVIVDAVSTTRDPNNAEQVAEHLAANIDGPHNYQWKYNSTSNTNDGFYHVDDIVIYSSDSGTETEVFSDNFQGRVAGEDLHPEVNIDSPYHPNTSEATVGEDQ